MAESSSIPGKGVIRFEAGDTLKRTISIKSGGLPVDLSGAEIEMIISTKEDGDVLATLTIGDGLIDSDLVNGEFKIFWQSAGVIEPKKSSYYKIKATFSDGTIKTYLEDKLVTV